MRIVPIVDTNIFVDSARGRIQVTEWGQFTKMRPGPGWPLSPVTLAELLIGLNGSDEHGFEEAQKALKLARAISKGKVLEQPPSLMKGVLQTYPVGSFSLGRKDVDQILESACRASSLHQLTSEGVPYKPYVYKGKKAHGVRLDQVEARIKGYTRSEAQRISELLGKVNPDWEETRKLEGASLPEASRSKLRDTYPDERWKAALARGFINRANADFSDPEVLEFVETFDLALTFLADILKKTLLSNYKYSEHPTDHLDFLQLLYLKDSHYCLVTNDVRLIRSVESSKHRDRVTSLSDFLVRFSKNSSNA